MSSTNAKLVPATAELWQRFFGRAEKRTVRALAMVRGEEVLGIGGYYVQDQCVVMFSDISEEGMKYRRLIVRGAYELLRTAAQRKLPAHVVPDPRILGAERFLAQLGFRPSDQGVWEWRI